MALDLGQGARGTAFDVHGGVVDYVSDSGVISCAQDVTDIIEANKQEQMEDRFRGFRKAPVFRKVASIPIAVFDIALAQGYDLLNDPEALRRFLNDPQNRAFRTTLEKV